MVHVAVQEMMHRSTFQLVYITLACLRHMQLVVGQNILECDYQIQAGCDPQDDYSPGNKNIELDCRGHGEERHVVALFYDTDYIDAAYFINCSNQTHFEISNHKGGESFCQTSLTSGTGLKYDGPKNVLGTVSCTVFGCYWDGAKKYNLNSTASGQICYFPEIGGTAVTVPLTASAPITSTSSAVTVPLTASAPITSMSSAVTVPLNMSTASVPIASTSVIPTSAVTVPLNMSTASVPIASTSVIPTSAIVTPTVRTAKITTATSMTTTGLSIRPTPTPIVHDQSIALPLMIIPVVIFVIVILTVCMIGILSVARWRKEKLMFNLRTGYGLQANEELVYEHISDAMLDMKFLSATSTLTIFDPFNHQNSKSVSTESLNSCLNQDIRNELEAMATYDRSSVISSNQTEGLENKLYISSLDYQPTGSSHSLNYLGNRQEFSTHKKNTMSTYHQALATHFSEPYLVPKKDGLGNSKSQCYVTALPYISNEAFSENDCSLLEDYPFNSGRPLSQSRLSVHPFSNNVTRSVSVQGMSTLYYSNEQGYII